MKYMYGFLMVALLFLAGCGDDPEPEDLKLIGNQYTLRRVQRRIA